MVTKTLSDQDRFEEKAFFCNNYQQVRVPRKKLIGFSPWKMNFSKFLVKINDKFFHFFIQLLVVTTKIHF